MSSNVSLTAENLSRLFTEDGQRGVSDISFEVKKGEIICVLGPSGAGKSTLLRLLCGLEQKDAGDLVLDQEVDQPGEIVYVPQDYTLWPHLTVKENLILAPRVVKNGDSKSIEQTAKDLLARFDLEAYLNTYPHELSGGQRQRIALIRAMMMRPKILLLDEVTSALDPELTKSVLDNIRSLAKDGYTMIVVTHHISLALAIADRILFLEKGKIVQNVSATQFFHEQTDPRILSFIQEIVKRDHAVEIFEGVEQFQAYHLGLLKRLPKNSTIHVAGAVGDRWYVPMGRFYEEYERMRVEKNITWRMCMYEFGEKDQELLKRHPDINEFRLMPRTLQNPANYNVMDDTVIMQIFGDKPTIIEIRDSFVAEAYIRFFEEMWEVSKMIATALTKAKE